MKIIFLIILLVGVCLVGGNEMQEGKLTRLLKYALKTTIRKRMEEMEDRVELLSRLAKLAKFIKRNDKPRSDNNESSDAGATCGGKVCGDTNLGGDNTGPGECSYQCSVCSAGACARARSGPNVEVLCSRDEGLQCVKIEMEKNSCCQVIDEPTDEAEVYSTTDFPLLSANMTIITHLNEYKYLSYVQLESYYKTECSNVLVLRLPQLQRVSPGTLVAFHQSDLRKPPEVLEGLVAALYRDVVLTIALPLAPGQCITHDAMQCAAVSASYDHPNTDLIFGVEILNSKVPIVGEIINLLPDAKNEILQELWIVEARVIANTIMRTQLCDFGVRDSKEYDATALRNINAFGSYADQVEEPCAGVGRADLTQCFLGFIGARAACCIDQGPQNQTLLRKNVDIYIPKCQASIRRHDFELKNLTATVESFIWNKSTGILTVSLRVKESFFLARSTLTAHRRGRHPVRVEGYTSARYEPMLNIIIPVNRGDDILVDAHALQRVFISSSFPDPAWIDVDLRFQNCNNPAIVKTIKCLRENANLVARHVFYEEGPSYFYMWLQKHLNFGLPIHCGHYQQHSQRF